MAEKHMFGPEWDAGTLGVANMMQLFHIVASYDGEGKYSLREWWEEEERWCVMRRFSSYDELMRHVRTKLRVHLTDVEMEVRALKAYLEKEMK